MSPNRTISAALSQGRRLLDDRSETPSLDAQLLLGASLAQTRTWLLAHPEAEIDEDSAARFDAWLRRRADGTPLPYLLGEWEFYGRKFTVTPDVLIPRPETERLVDLALERLKKRTGSARVLDVGTGSGCIAVTLALSHPESRVLGLDISPGALRVARSNAERYAVDNLALLESDLLANLPAGWVPADLICANLPYIPTEALAALEVSAHEPVQALDGGPDGLAVISRLLDQANSALAPGGLLLLEIEAGQGSAACALAASAFPGAGVRCVRDYAGHQRIVMVESL